MFKFGVSEKDITPRNGMCIPGYYSKRFVSGVLDNLYAKAMVFENGGDAYAVVVCDTINLNRDDVLRIRKGIQDACGIKEKNISVSASHTHTGGPTWAWYDAATREPLYITMLVDAAVSAAQEAYNSRKPAKIGFVKSELVGYSWIRRFKMKDGTYRTNPGIGNPDVDAPLGTPDNSVIVGKVTDLDGKPVAFISNYGVHLDMVGGSEVSADYPGEISKLIKEKYGDGVVSVFFTGPCGNTNHHNVFEAPVKSKTEELYGDLPIHKKTGHAIFDVICDAEGKIELSDSVCPAVAREFFTAKLRLPYPGYKDAAERYLRGEDVKFMGYGMEHLGYNERQHIAHATLDAYNNETHMIDVEVMVLTLGDTAMVMWPAEVFVEYGKAVRERFADKNVIIAELTNGSFGCYLPTEEALEQGGYEPTITGPNTPEPQTGNKMVETTIDLLSGLGF